MPTDPCKAARWRSDPAIETAARAPEPWCVIHDSGCSIPGIPCAEHCPRAASHGPRGAFGWRRFCRLGSLIEIGWKGTPIPAYLAEHLCCFDAAERMWRLRESKIYRRYPSEIHLASALKSDTVVAIWLPEKNGLLGYFYNRLIIKDKMAGAHGLEPWTR